MRRDTAYTRSAYRQRRGAGDAVEDLDVGGLEHALGERRGARASLQPDIPSASS
jgi:hypothetical protein